MISRFLSPLCQVAASATLLTLAAHAADSPTPSARIEQIPQQAITVDGKLDEALYEAGSWNSGFTVVRSSDKAVNQTEFRLFTDGQKLYFTARMHKNGGDFRNAGRERDSVPLHSGDHINLFIRATDDPSEYLQFLITSAGAISDIRLTQSGVTKDYSWNTDMVAGSQVDAKAGVWTVEMAVPLASLNIDPALKEWHANVGRLTVLQRKADGGPREFNSWIASPTEIENANSLAPMDLPDFDRSIFGWSLRHSPVRVILKDGKSYLATTATLTNQTGAKRTVTLRSQLDGVKQTPGEQEVTLAAGESREVATLFPLGGEREAKGLFRLSVLPSEADAGQEGQLWALATELIDVAYAPAILKLTEPGYRATIFASQKLKTLRAVLDRWDTYAEISDVQGVLIAEDGTRYPAKVNAGEDANGDRWQIAVEGIDGVADGNYRLEVTFAVGGSGASDAAQQTLTRAVRKVPHQPGEMWIDEKGVVYRDGKPFPSYGFHYGRRDATGKAQGFLPGMFYNTYLPVWVKAPFTGEAIKTATDLAERGILPIVNVLPVMKTGTHKNPPDELTEEERAEVRALGLAMRHNASIAGYYLADEPEYRGMTPRRLQQIYEVLREADPYHPVILTNNTDEAVRNYQLCSDIHNPDPYPLFLTGGGPARHFTRIASHVSNVQIGEESYRALWITPQAFDLQPFRPGETGHRGPNAVEMRAQQTIALIHRAVGVTWYTEEYAWEEPGVTSSLPYLSQEYLWLFPHLVEARPEVLKTPRTVTASLSTTGRGALLIVVNLERAETKITLSDPRLKGHAAWHRIGDEGKPLVGGAESLELTLAPHESVILASEGLPLPEKLPSWASVLKEEERLAKAIDRSPENIALWANGSTAKAVGGGGWNAFLTTNGIKETRSSAFYSPHFKKGMGLQITFPEEKTPRKVVITGANILKGAVQVSVPGAKNKWVEVARIDQATPSEELALTFEGKKTRSVRIVADTILPAYSNALRIVHISIYE